MIPGSERHIDRHQKAYADVFQAQRLEVVGGGGFAQTQWDRTLASVVGEQARRTVKSFGEEIASRYGIDWDPDLLSEYLDDYARITAEATNATTALAVADAADADALAHVFEVLVGSKALQMARSKVGSEANLGRHEAAQQGGIGEKRWVVTSRNPRSTHARLNGETVPIGETFSNGARWPGDASLTVDDRANCACMVTFD